MTKAELNVVRAAREAIANDEKALETMRRAEALKIPILADMPKSRSIDSRVERIAIRIIDASRYLDKLKKRLQEELIPELEGKIYAEFSNPAERTLLILRYVECLFFKDIAITMGYSVQHVYRIHNKILKKMRVDVT